MMQIENSFFELAEASERNCLIICDRGTMDASAFVAREDWEELLHNNRMDEVDIRDNRYNQVKIVDWVDRIVISYIYFLCQC